MKIRILMDGERLGDADINDDIITLVPEDEKAKFLARHLEPYLEAMLKLKKEDRNK